VGRFIPTGIEVVLAVAISAPIARSGDARPATPQAQNILRTVRQFGGGHRSALST
jgi:hypothetical protein